MKQLNNEHIINDTEECAGAILDVIPRIMTIIRYQASTCLPADMTLPQFRVLIFIQRHPGTSLSTIGERLGLTVSSISKIIDVLVKRGDVQHTVSSTDRRIAELSLTDQGFVTLQNAFGQTEQRLIELLSPLSAEECRMVNAAMACLQRIDTIARQSCQSSDQR